MVSLLRRRRLSRGHLRTPSSSDTISVAPPHLVCSHRAGSRVQLQRLAELVYTFDLPVSVLVLAISVLLPLVTFIIAFQITERVSNGTHWRQKGYFLSAAIDLPPASNVGALGLTLSFASFLLVTFVRHKIVKQRLGATRSALLHRLSLACAFAAAFGGNGVAAYQHSVSRSVHNAFAALFVLSALAHFCLEAFIEWRGQLAPPPARALHACLCMVAAACTATFLGHVIFEEGLSTEVAQGGVLEEALAGLKAVGGTPQPPPLRIGKLRAAQAEMATVGCFLLYLCSYLPTFRCARIHFSITLAEGGKGGRETPPHSPVGAKARRNVFELEERCPSYSALAGGLFDLR